MITFDELRRVAGELGIPEEKAELDYVHGWVLAGLDAASREAGVRLLLKGGAALGKVYLPGARTSRDIDLTVLRGQAGTVELGFEAMIDAAIRFAVAESGLRFEPPEIKVRAPSVAEKVAFEARLPFVGPRRSERRPSKVKVDASTYELVAWEEQRRSVHHPFGDGCRPEVWVYAIEEVLAEKIRTVLQRPQVLPKDVFDVWLLWGRLRPTLDRALFLDRLLRKCEYKGVRFSTSAFQARLRDPRLESSWYASLAPWVAEVPALDEVRSGPVDPESLRRSGGLSDPVIGIGWLEAGGRW